MDHRSIRREAEAGYHERLSHLAHGGSRPLTPAEDERADKKLAKHVADQEVERGIKEHDQQLHGGKKTRLQLADGGCAEGGSTRRRMDRAGRARGGGMPHLGSPKGHRGGHGSHVNVIVAPGGGGARPVPVPVPAAGLGGAPPMARPPMAPAGPPMGGGGPPMGGGMRPPMAGVPMAGGMMRAEGGVVPPPPKETAGRASGEGRLESTRAARKTRSAALEGPY